MFHRIFYWIQGNLLLMHLFEFMIVHAATVELIWSKHITNDYCIKRVEIDLTSQSHVMLLQNDFFHDFHGSCQENVSMKNEISLDDHPFVEMMLWWLKAVIKK